MTPNVGQIDRGLRALLGVVLLLAPMLNMPAIWSSDVYAYLSMAVGIVMLATAIFGYCPVYGLFGVRTTKTH